MKKALAILLTAVMLLGVLTACGSKKDDAADDTQNTEDTDNAAASYPTKNVNVIVPFSAGGNTDMSMRAAERGDQP